MNVTDNDFVDSNSASGKDWRPIAAAGYFTTAVSLFAASAMDHPYRTALLPGGLPDRSLVAEQVDSPTPFQVSGATLSRNAVVEMDFIFARADDQIRIEHAVQVRNVP